MSAPRCQDPRRCAGAGVTEGWCGLFLRRCNERAVYSVACAWGAEKTRDGRHVKSAALGGSSPSCIPLRMFSPGIC